MIASTDFLLFCSYLCLLLLFHYSLSGGVLFFFLFNFYFPLSNDPSTRFSLFHYQILLFQNICIFCLCGRSSSSSSSSSRCADSTDSFCSFSVSHPVPIDNRAWIFLKTASSVHANLINESFCWSVITDVSMSKNQQENVAYDFVLTSSAVPTQHVLLVLLGWYAWWELSGHTAAGSLGVDSKICSKQHAAYLYRSHLVFPSGISLKYKQCNHILVLI